MAVNKIIQSGNKRFWIYIMAAVVLLAAILATVITLGHIDTEDVTLWMALVVTLVGEIVGFGQSILAALNTDRDTPQPVE